MAEEKIYTVEFESYDGGGLHGIYRTREEAQERLKRIAASSKGYYKLKSKNLLAEVYPKSGEFMDSGSWFVIYERKFGDVEK